MASFLQCKFLLFFLIILLPFSNAMFLSDYPAHFVDKKNLANLAVVVGDHADSSDVLGAVDIIQSLQAQVMRSAPLPKPLNADSVEIGSASDLLTFNEQIGGVREVLTEVDLDLLKGGQIVTDKGSTEYNQYLRFLKDNSTSGTVRMTKDERDRVGHFLYFNASSLLFEWELEFEEGLESEVKGNDLVDLEDKDITILGLPFVIVDTDIFNRSDTNTSGGSPDLTIEFMAGAVSAVLGENDKETYVVDGKEYEVEVLVISETAVSGEGSVKFRINGEITDSLSDGDTDVLNDGTQIGVRDILATEKDIQKSLVQFYIGAFKVEFRDSNTSDNIAIVGTEVNEETIEDSNVQIKGQFTSDPAHRSGTQSSLNGARFEVQNIKYNLTADAVLGDMFVPPGTGVRAQLDEPEGMLTPNWDILYKGLEKKKETVIAFNPIGDDKYRMNFNNQEGIFYDIPILNRAVENTAGGSLKYGDEDRSLWFTEFLNVTGDAGGTFTTALQGSFLFFIALRDSFILSKCHSGDNNDNTCSTHVLRYDDIDTTNRRLTFKDLGTGERKVVYDSTTFVADLVVGGITYKLGIENDGTTVLSPYRLMADFNGNGIRDNCTTVRIGVPGGGLISFGEQVHPAASNNISIANNNLTSFCGLNADGTLIASTVVNHNATSLTVATLPKALDGVDASGSSPVTGGGNLSSSTPNTVTIPVSGFDPNLSEENNLALGATVMGDIYELESPPGKSSTLKVRYPAVQRGVQVFVVGPGRKEEIEVAGFKIGAAKLASEVADVSQYNAIVVGGPCANKVAAALLGNPEACHESVPVNKAVVKLFEHANGNVALLVNGRTAEKTREASRAVASGALSKENSDTFVI